MNQEFIEFPRSIKSCSVVLERLDEKLVSQYSQKYNIKIKDVIKHSKIYSKNFSDYSKGNRQKVKKSVKINKLKKRRKIRVISSSDDESSNESSKVIKHIVTGINDGVINDDSRKPEKILGDSRSLEISNSKYAENDVEVIQEITKSQKDVENESDLREENEDDKITVIFEETSNKKSEIECSVEVFRNKLSTISTIRISELEEKVAEKSAVNEPTREDYLKKLCSLVKRLHELFRIISQLQRSEPQSDNLAAHFLKVIKTQKTSFLREIKLSQKPVIECYEKLLTFYKNSNEVITKVSQNALLSLEDVSNIISRCLLQGKFHQVQKSNKIQPKNLKRSSNNFKKLFIEKKVNKNNLIAPHLNSFPSSEDVSYHYEIIPTADEFVIPMVIPAEKDVVNIQKPSNHGFRKFSPSYNDYYIQKQNIWTQTRNQIQAFDPLCTASPPNEFRYPSVVLNRHSYPQYMSSNFLVNPTISQKRPSIEFSAPEIPTHPFRAQQFYVPNVIQQNSILEQASLGNFNSPLQNISTYAAVRQRHAEKRSLVSLSNAHHKGVQRLSRHPMGGYFDSARTSKQNSCEWLASEEEIFEKPSFNNIDAQEVLDHTVPGFLPIKNYSTQGFTAVRATEENRTKSFQSFSEMETFSGLRKESSNFRIYFCAQSNCKMPGIRVCKGCQSVIYCSANCQLKHWALKHSTECHQLRELRVA